MNVKFPLGALLILAAVLGYLLGTESGRQQRDSLVRKVRRDESIDELIDAVDEAVADQAATEVASAEG
jgi:uncharacterized membrane protein